MAGGSLWVSMSNGEPEQQAVSGEIRTLEQARSEIAEWKLRYELAAFASGQLVYDYEVPSGEIVWSGNLEAVLGFTPEEMAGGITRWTTLLHPQDTARVLEALAASEASGTIFDYEYRFQHKSGHYIDVHDIGTFVYGGGKAVRMVGAMRDVTAAKRAARELHESRERFKSIFDNMQDAYLRSDAAGVITLVNPATVRFLGYAKAEELLGKSIIEDIWVNKENRQELSARLARTGQVHGFRAEFRRLDGSIWIAEVNIRIILGSQGEVVGMEGIARDVSERLRFEQVCLEAKNAAEAATRAKADFLANISHEIRTPMNAIVGLTHLALKTPVTPRQSDYLTKIETSALNLLALVNDVLDYSNAESGVLELESTPFELRHILSTVSAAVSARAEEKGLRLVVLAHPDVPQMLVGDAVRLGQVLINLTGNAVKFTEKGAVRLSIELVARHGEKAKIAFHVADTGIGIPETQMAHLFDPFTQADSSLTRQFGGTGLGLAICKQLVERMGGQISVESIPGQGSTFSFVLEFWVPAVTSLHQAEPPAELKSLRVLAIDDNDASRTRLLEVISGLGLKVTGTASGPAGLEELARAAKAGERLYDLVLLDWNMPGMDGIETATRIRTGLRLEKRPAILMVTDHGREEIIRQADLLGLEGFLLRPLTSPVVLDTIVEIFTRDRRAQGAPELARKGETLPELKLAGTHVLIVEDNAINQQVAREILEAEGVLVDVAENGAQAIEILKKSATDFDAVLMDLQMPKMDGYQATRMIRLGLKNQILPVIAMTAHTSDAEKESCLRAGMNDHVAKPVNAKQLYDVLTRWIAIGGYRQRIAAPAKVAVAPEDPAAFPDSLPGLDVRAGMERLRGNRALLVRLLGDFSRQASEIVASIRTLIDQNEWESARRQAHTLKGISGNLSAFEMYSTVQQLDTAFLKGEMARVPEIMASLETALLHVTAASAYLSARIESRAAVPAALSPGSSDTGRLSAKLIEFDRLLRKNSLQATRIFASIRQDAAFGAFSEKVDLIEQHLARLDFKGARKFVDEIARELGVSDVQSDREDGFS